MVSRYIYWQIIVRVIVIIVASIAGTWLTLATGHWVYAVVFGLIVLWFAVRLMYNLNDVNRKIAYFFNAVENEDATLHYPEKISHASFRDLNKSLNRVNNLIKEVKLKNREQEQYYSALLEQVPTGIMVINANGNILQANSTAKDLLHYRTLTHIVQLKRVDEAIYHALDNIKNGSPQQLVNVTYDNTSIQLTLRASEFKNRAERFTLIAVQDIHNELETKEAEAWIKLIRVLTHEIMNSISPITSLSETLLGYYQDGQTVDDQTLKNTVKGLEVINERGIGLIKFVESYRKLTKIPQPVLKNIRAKVLIDDIKTLMLNEPHFNQIVFKTDIQPEDLTLTIDKEQMTQVLINLITNALQALKNTEQPTIHIKAYKTEDNRMLIEVADNGKGIPPEIIDQIFIPFFTTKDQGSGIGLSLTKQIMRLHGGRIEVFSKLGQGSRFVLTF